MFDKASRNQQSLDRSNHSRDIQLIIDCCRTSVPKAVSARISAALRESIDWTFTFNVARRNAVLPLLGRTLTRDFIEQLPTDISRTIESEQERHLCHNLFLTGKLIETVKFFRENGVNVLPFKGPLLAVEAYGDPSYRMFNDLDILVQPKQFRKAVDLLTKNGWKP